MDDANRSKGQAFVQFENERAAEIAIELVNRRVIKDRVIWAAPYQPRTQRQTFLSQQFHQQQQQQQRLECLANHQSPAFVYVKNLDAMVDDALLKETLGKHGNVTSAIVMTDEQGTSKRFGFVSFSSPNEARQAVKSSGIMLGSKPIYVALALPNSTSPTKLSI